MKRIKKVKKFYPNCNIELTCLLDFDDDFGEKTEHTESLLIDYSWMKKIRPYARSITKLTLKATHEDVSAFSNFLTFENLDSLDLDLKETREHAGIEFVGAEFWKKFPNLKSLRIKSYGFECISTSLYCFSFARLIFPCYFCSQLLNLSTRFVQNAEIWNVLCMMAKVFLITKSPTSTQECHLQMKRDFQRLPI